jgi:branched-chain amino acid transport system substrate-binding protein
VNSIDRRGVLTLLAGAGAAGLVGCEPGSSSPEPEPLYDTHVRIGLLVPGSGGYKPIGDEILNGFRRYLRNTGNRLGGHPVVEELGEEGDSPEAAQAGLTQLLERDVLAVVGMASSTALLAVSQTVQEQLVPLLSANASPQELQGAPYVWRTSYVNNEPGLALGGYLAAATDGPIVAIAPDDPFGTDVLAGLQEGLAGAQAEDRLNPPILTAPEDLPGQDFFADPLAQAAAADPGAVVGVYAGSSALEFVRQYTDAGLDPLLLYGPADLTEGAVLTELADAAAGIWTAANYAAELRGAANRSFTVAYRAEFGAPTTYAVAGYDAAAALDTAIRLVGAEPDRRQVNLALGEVGLIDSPRGRWQFNQNRTPTQTWYLRQVERDGAVLANLVVEELGTLG